MKVELVPDDDIYNEETANQDVPDGMEVAYYGKYKRFRVFRPKVIYPILPSISFLLPLSSVSG